MFGIGTLSKTQHYPYNNQILLLFSQLKGLITNIMIIINVKFNIDI